MQLRFDTTALEIPNLSTDITAGSLDPNWTIATYSPSPGVVNILSYADQPITVPPSGTVLNILFQVLSAGPWAIGLADYDGTGYDYQSGSITPTGLGDANLDGRVDINDLTIVLSHYNQTGMTWTEGEFTGDGTVDINDLTIVLANYNKTYGASLGRWERGAGADEPDPARCRCYELATVNLKKSPSAARLTQLVDVADQGPTRSRFWNTSTSLVFQQPRGSVAWLFDAEASDLGKVGDRLFVVAFLPVGTAPSITRLGEFRIEPNRLGEVGNGFVAVALAPVAQPRSK